MARGLHFSRRVPLGIALIVALWCGEPVAESSSAVAVLPVEDTAGLTEADRTRIEQRMREALSAPRLRLADAQTAQRAASCATQMCQRRTFATHGVSYWLTAQVRGGNRMYEVELTLWSDHDDEPVARTQEQCSVCGRAELTELVAAQTLNLRRWITQTSTTPAVLTIDPRPRQARVWIDGEAVGRGAVRREVSPGRHTVRVAADGYEPSNRTITVSRGVTQDVDVELRPAKRRPNLRPWGIAALTTGIAVTTGGAVMLGLHGRSFGPRCEEGSSNIDGDGDCRYVYRTLAGGVVATVAGIGLTATGVTLLAWNGRTPDGRQRAKLRLKLQPKRLVLSGRF